MKKMFLTLLMFTLILFTSCSYLLKEPKVNNYYTSNLNKLLDSNNDYKCYIFDMNFYKEKNLISEDFYVLSNFVKTLEEKSFIKKHNNISEKPTYKIILDFTSEKYVINVFNNKYITLHPWDGKEEMDYIDMSNVPASYNLFYLCNYMFSGKQ